MRLPMVPLFAFGLVSAPLVSADIGTGVACLLLPHMTALVNPSLQPQDLYERYLCVLCLEVTSVDTASNTVELVVRSVAKGDFAARTVRLSLASDEVQSAFQSLPEPGLALVAFVGQKGRNRESSILFYLGGEGRWQNGSVKTAGDAGSPAAWTWDKDLGNEMFGTFNGHPARLAELVRDCAAGGVFFPATVFDRFHADQVLGKLPGPAQGLALYDIDGDGRLDALAVGPAGGALYLQREVGTFSDVSAASGLAALKGVSVDCADVDGDGQVDLLVDGRIVSQDASGHFAEAKLLPALTGTVLMSRFVDLDGDGWPDVVVAMDGAGLRAFHHPTQAGKPFVEVTDTLGFGRSGVKAGYFVPGDWRGDAAPALFVASSTGALLERGPDGLFAAPSRLPGWDFTASSGYTGGGACAPLWQPDRCDLAFATDKAVNIVSFASGKAEDVGRYGNETQVAMTTCVGLLAEDLNADGNVDLYAISRTAGESNALYDNRGYGSFMVGTRYRADAIPGKAHGNGSIGAAAGDVDGDGANDLLLGAVDGQLTLLVNNVLAGRGASEHPSQQDRVLAKTALLHIEVGGPRGVVGAAVTVADAKGRVVGRRIIGGSPVTGSRGPDAATVAVREPGEYHVRVRWSDGATRDLPVVLKAGARSALRAERP